MKTVKAIMFWLLSLTWGALMTLCGGVVALALHYLIYFEVGSGWGGFELGAFFVVNKNPSLHILQHESGHGLQNIMLGVFMPLLLVFPLVFAIGGASTKYEKDSATLYRPTIEYGLKVGQPASAKNILIDKTKNALARRRFLLLVFGVSRRYARRQSLYCNRNFARCYRPLYRRFRRQV